MAIRMLRRVVVTAAADLGALRTYAAATTVQRLLQHGTRPLQDAVDVAVRTAEIEPAVAFDPRGALDRTDQLHAGSFQLRSRLHDVVDEQADDRACPVERDVRVVRAERPSKAGRTFWRSGAIRATLCEPG